MTRCKNGTRKNKQGICSVYRLGTKTKSRRKTRTKSKIRTAMVKDEWNSEIDKEFKEILKELRTGKLHNMDFNKPIANTNNNNNCLKNISLQELQHEIDLQKKDLEHINILIPRKKIK